MMTEQEITAKYNITKQTLNSWIYKKEIPTPVKKGRQNVWTSEQIKVIDKKVVSYFSDRNELVGQKNARLQIANRRYLGSKQKLLDFIDEVVKIIQEM